MKQSWNTLQSKNWIHGTLQRVHVACNESIADRSSKLQLWPIALFPGISRSSDHLLNYHANSHLLTKMILYRRLYSWMYNLLYYCFLAVVTKFCKWYSYSIPC